MRQLQLDGHYGVRIELDVCRSCHGLWFDERESLRLTPGATLQLFETIHECPDDGRQPIGDRLQCPRCNVRLLATHDRQRDTPFRYWRCPRRHGRFITFFDFLREKEFIRPLSPAQVAELRSQIRSVQCSNCGAPIDLQTASACGYCRAPLSMLDVAQVERMLHQLSDAEHRRVAAEQLAGLDPLLPLALLRERQHVASLFGTREGQPSLEIWPRHGGIVEAGISAVLSALRKAVQPTGRAKPVS
jgi:Zn-finger nucleic acid-binding protein